MSNAVVHTYSMVDLRDFRLFDFRIHKETEEAYLLEVNLICSFGFENVMIVMDCKQDYTDKDNLQMVISKAIATLFREDKGKFFVTNHRQTNYALNKYFVRLILVISLQANEKLTQALTYYTDKSLGYIAS